MHTRVLLFALMLLGSPAARAERLVIDATNPGPIDDIGRDLQFDLSLVPAPIVSAQLIMDIHYDNAREPGVGGECRNLLARYLEFDVDRLLPLTLRIE